MIAGNSVECVGCIHSVRRMKHSRPTHWCNKYHCRATVKCIDYRSKAQGVHVAINYLKASRIK